MLRQKPQPIAKINAGEKVTTEIDRKTITLVGTFSIGSSFGTDGLYLVSRPKIILADEPTAALDSKSGREVVNLMQSLAKDQGYTIFLVTHDDRILDIADRIVHMEDGCLQ